VAVARATDATILSVVRDIDATKVRHHAGPMLQEHRLEAPAGWIDPLRTLGEAGRSVASALGKVELLDTIADWAAAITRSKACALFRYVGEERALRLWRKSRLDPRFVSMLRDVAFDEDETLMGEALRRNTTVAVGDMAALPISVLRSASLAAEYRSVLIVPLIGAERTIGALALLREPPCEFASDTLELARFLPISRRWRSSAVRSRTKSMPAVTISTSPAAADRHH
jgi:transcriptional regulator with GAF, ATPase, and Fis domain